MTDPPRLVLNLGVPRSGTVLIGAIIREVIARSGGRTEIANPHGTEVADAIRAALAAPQAGSTCILHTHSWPAGADAPLAPGRACGFVNLRDPRDVCVSLMQLHDHPFGDAAAMVEAAFAHADAMSARGDLVTIRYESLVADVEDHVRMVAARLGGSLDADDVTAIADATSIDRHRRIMTDLQAGRRRHVRVRQNRHRLLVEDADTLINARHIQSGRIGRWRTELSAEQQRRANRRFGPILAALGYEPDASSAGRERPR